MLFPFNRILWVKSVTMEEELAYPGRAGDEIELHSTEEDADSLGDPAVGDIVVLTQHDQVTHLVEVRGERVEPRPKRTIRRGTRDARFSMQRTCVIRLVLDLERAPFIEDAFGFEPNTGGGEVFELATLPAFVQRKQPLWMLQRRIHQAMAKNV